MLGHMSKLPSVEIQCPACGTDSLLIRRPVYDGFKKTGESLHCASCGHRFDSESDVPFKVSRSPKIFTEEDRSEEVQLFEENEHRRLCRYCVHYVVNPFTQWCARHRKEVAATDSCPQFEEQLSEKTPEVGGDRI